MKTWQKLLIIFIPLLILSAYGFRDAQFRINQNYNMCTGGNGGDASLNIHSKGNLTIEGSNINVIGGNAGCNNFEANTPKLQRIISLLGIILSSIVSVIAIYDWWNKRSKVPPNLAQHD